MDKTANYLQKLRDDLLEQFKGKSNIQIFQKAMARQLDELYAFFYRLRVMRWLQNAKGVQLDGIGNIVDLSRTDALIWSNTAGLNVPMDDALYRMYLWFKIFLNTSQGTYKDVYRALRMFWSHTPIVYSERRENPATMFFDLVGLGMDSQYDVRVFSIARRVKAAGVQLRLTAKFEPIPIPVDIGFEFYKLIVKNSFHTATYPRGLRWNGIFEANGAYFDAVHTWGSNIERHGSILHKTAFNLGGFDVCCDLSGQLTTDLKWDGSAKWDGSYHWKRRANL